MFWCPTARERNSLRSCAGSDAGMMRSTGLRCCRRQPPTVSNTGKKQLEEKGALHSVCDDCARALAEGFYDDTVGLVTETEKHEFWEVRE